MQDGPGSAQGGGALVPLSACDTRSLAPLFARDTRSLVCRDVRIPIPHDGCGVGPWLAYFRAIWLLGWTMCTWGSRLLMRIGWVVVVWVWVVVVGGVGPHTAASILLAGAGVAVVLGVVYRLVQDVRAQRYAGIG